LAPESSRAASAEMICRDSSSVSASESRTVGREGASAGTEWGGSISKPGTFGHTSCRQFDQATFIETSIGRRAATLQARRIEGVETDVVLKNAVAAHWDGIDVRVISLDDLIANKRAAGRPQDLADVARLVRARPKGRIVP
jgi:hypothetical protein